MLGLTLGLFDYLLKSLFCLLEEIKELEKYVFFKEAQLGFSYFFCSYCMIFVDFLWFICFNLIKA